MGAVDETTTEASASGEPTSATRGWTLAIAFFADRPAATPRRVRIGDATTITIGRGETGWLRSRATIALHVDDRLTSTEHARLSRSGDAWSVEDLGSKNGTRVNGAEVSRAPVRDGDVLECGGCFMVLRDAGGVDLDAPSGPHAALRTLSETFARELELLGRVARARVPVLVRGETGTGKEIAARVLHELSGRNGPMVAVNCGALAPTLITSDLFGVKRGAFSGATEDRPGFVRSAHGGTLFLDEIAELPLEAQAALLRVIQESEVIPVGATTPVRVDLRIVAATHRSLDDASTFRRDLLARLRGYELKLPTLHQRREDLGLLVASLLAKIDPTRQWTFRRTAARALFMYEWPAHVRELEQALRAGTAIADGDEIALEDLPVIFRESPATTAPAIDERDRFVALVNRFKGNVSKIATELATSRSQVRRLAQRFEISLDDAR